MDILKPMNDLFTGGGLLKIIHDFRTPTSLDELYFSAKYLPESDSKYYKYDEDQPSYNPFTDGVVLIPFSSHLKSRLQSIHKKINEDIDNLQLIIKDDPLLKSAVTENSHFNFIEARQYVFESDDLKNYKDDIISFINSVESKYRKLVSDISKVGVSSKNNSLSFEFKNKEIVLKKIYHELVLEKGDFIDKDKTSYVVFINILCAQKLSKEIGTICFGCETRQAAYILHKMQLLFANLTFSAIEKSQMFKSKRGTLIKADSLSKYINEMIEIKQKEFIDTFFQKVYNK